MHLQKISSGVGKSFYSPKKLIDRLAVRQYTGILSRKRIELPVVYEAHAAPMNLTFAGVYTGMFSLLRTIDPCYMYLCILGGRDDRPSGRITRQHFVTISSIRMLFTSRLRIFYPFIGIYIRSACNWTKAAVLSWVTSKPVIFHRQLRI